MGADPAAAAFDAVGPAVRLRTMGNGQAGDLELNAVDGGGHGWVAVVCIVQARGAERNPLHERKSRAVLYAIVLQDLPLN